MVEQGILCWSHEAMCHWQRCDLLSSCHHRFSNADLEDPLDHLADLAADLFSPIPNRGQIPLPSIPDHPFGPDEKGVRSAFTSHLSVTEL
jgi:hypothetical protein